MRLYVDAKKRQEKQNNDRTRSNSKNNTNKNSLNTTAIVQEASNSKQKSDYFLAMKIIKEYEVVLT